MEDFLCVNNRHAKLTCARKALVVRMRLAISWDPWGNDDEIELARYLELPCKSRLPVSVYVSVFVARGQSRTY